VKTSWAAVHPPARPAAPVRFADTYSIVARDPATGQLGVAVQSHYFGVGATVPWAEAGVGAVATQSLVLIDYGPKGLDRMRAGLTARQALDSLLAEDPHPGGRQVAMVDARGGVAAYTGPGCIPDAGHLTGDQLSVQANLMSNPRVWPAMKQAFERAQGDFTERLLQALEAAEEAGGDIRGRQSAALLVVSGQPSGRPWADRIFDLHVEDSPEPLQELRRLTRLRRAYILEDEGDSLVGQDRLADALSAYEAAAALAPEVPELRFWAAVAMHAAGRRADALASLAALLAEDARWAQLLGRLARAGLLPDDSALIDELRPR
jgi:uncharacterized Ntn-hydrolase superfamily protein